MSKEFEDISSDGIHKEYNKPVGGERVHQYWKNEDHPYWYNTEVNMSVAGSALSGSVANLTVDQQMSYILDKEDVCKESLLSRLSPTDVDNKKNDNSVHFNRASCLVWNVALGKIHKRDFPDDYKNNPMLNVFFSRVKVNVNGEVSNDPVACPTVIESEIEISKEIDYDDPRKVYHSSWQLENHPEKAAARAAWQDKQPDDYKEVSLHRMTVNSGNIDVTYSIKYNDQPELAHLFLSNKCNMVTLPNPLYEEPSADEYAVQGPLSPKEQPDQLWVRDIPSP